MEKLEALGSAAVAQNKVLSDQLDAVKDNFETTMRPHVHVTALLSKLVINEPPIISIEISNAGLTEAVVRIDMGAGVIQNSALGSINTPAKKYKSAVLNNSSMFPLTIAGNNVVVAKEARKILMNTNQPITFQQMKDMDDERAKFYVYGVAGQYSEVFRRNYESIEICLFSSPDVSRVISEHMAVCGEDGGPNKNKPN